MSLMPCHESFQSVHLSTCLKSVDSFLGVRQRDNVVLSLCSRASPIGLVVNHSSSPVSLVLQASRRQRPKSGGRFINSLNETNWSNIGWQTGERAGAGRARTHRSHTAPPPSPLPLSLPPSPSLFSSAPLAFASPAVAPQMKNYSLKTRREERRGAWPRPRASAPPPTSPPPPSDATAGASSKRRHDNCWP